LRAALEIRRRRPDIGVLILSHFVPVRCSARPRGSGAGRRLPAQERSRHARELIAAVRRVGGAHRDRPTVAERPHNRRRGRCRSTSDRREREYSRAMAQGDSNAALAERLVLSPRTVDAHVRTIS